jgi:hypothetical protein
MGRFYALLGEKEGFALLYLDPAFPDALLLVRSPTSLIFGSFL